MQQGTTLETTPNSTDPFPSESDYMQVLERFILYSERGWHKDYLGNPDLGYFGDSGSGENGIRSMGNYVFITSLLASDESYNSAVGGLDRQTLLNRAKCGLNYMTRSHVTGDICCGDGGKWGNGWRSPWWTTNMAMGARLIWDSLSDAERAAVERVVVSEANRQLDRIVPSGLIEDTKAEENAWDTESLATAIALFPNHEMSDRWREKFIEFTLNTLSAPQDRVSDAEVEGRILKEHVYTVNIYSDYTLENQGAYQFCFVASLLLSVTWSYYALFSNGQHVPETLFHHVKDLWDTAKPTFLDNRFAYMGGKGKARYTYGLCFIVPALVMLQHKYNDTDARTIEMARVNNLIEELQDNGDGSFFGQRLTHNQMFGDSVMHETDSYACLALAYLLHKRLKTDKQATPPQEFPQRISGRVISQESGTCYLKTPKLFASFSWLTLGKFCPTALFIPAGMDNSAEWLINNLLGRVKIPIVDDVVWIRTMKAKGEGFIVEGVLSYRHRTGEAFAHEVHYTVIPEKNIAIVESRFTAKSKILVLYREGLRFALVNDRFNNYKREYKWDGGSATINFDPNQAQTKQGLLARVSGKARKLLDLDVVNREMGHSWVNIDDKLGIVQLKADGAPFNLRQEPGRNTFTRCLHYDLLDHPRRRPLPEICKAGEVLLHTKVLLVAGTAAETEALAIASKDTQYPGLSK